MTTNVIQADGCRFESPLTRVEVDELLRRPHLFASDGVRRRRFPRLAASVRIQDVPLTVRVQTCLETLQKRHNLEGLSDLSRFTIGQLLGLKNFGRKSMADLLASLRTLIVDDDVGRQTDSSVRPLSALVTAAAERLRAQSYSSRIRCTDPRFGRDACALLVIANGSSDEPELSPLASLHTVAHRLVGRKHDNSPPELVLGAITKIRSKVARARHLHLEKELDDIASSFLAGKSTDIALGFLGWSGNGVKTLQAAGDEHHITRERVRQITSKFAKKVKSAHPFVPTLKRVVAFVTRRLPVSSQEVEVGLREAGLTRSLFRSDGIIAAAGLLGLPVSFVIEEHHGSRTLVRHEDAGLTKSVIRLARKVVSRSGIGNVADLRDLVHEEKGTLLEDSVVGGILQGVNSLRWLGDGHEWFLLMDTPRNHLITLVAKVLSVAPCIHVNEMRAAIASDYRGVGFSPPRHVVLEFCKTACDCDIDVDTIVARHPPSQDLVLSEYERLACAVLKDEGRPLLHRNDFERLCIERGMNPSTFANYVGRLYILARYGPGVYGLRGAAVVPGDVRTLCPSGGEEIPRPGVDCRR